MRIYDAYDYDESTGVIAFTSWHDVPDDDEPFRWDPPARWCGHGYVFDDYCRCGRPTVVRPPEREPERPPVRAARSGWEPLATLGFWLFLAALAFFGLFDIWGLG